MNKITTMALAGVLALSVAAPVLAQNTNSESHNTLKKTIELKREEIKAAKDKWVADRKVKSQAVAAANQAYREAVKAAEQSFASSTASARATREAAIKAAQEAYTASTKDARGIREAAVAAAKATRDAAIKAATTTSTTP